MLVTERTETMQLMDELEALVMKRGWPVPFSDYYVVHHERLLSVVDRLRVSLQDELDERFLQAFSKQQQQETVSDVNRKEPQTGQR